MNSNKALAVLLSNRRRERHVPPTGAKANRRWSLRGIAAMLKVSPDTVMCWERGHLPHKRLLSAIARVYRLPPKDVSGAHAADAKAMHRQLLGVIADGMEKTMGKPLPPEIRASIATL